MKNEIFLFKGMNIIEFHDKFNSDDACKEYLSYFKWKDGFSCSKCHHTHYWLGIKPYTRVCKNCRHVESPTSNTLFHKVKFGLRKAFSIVFIMSTSSKGSSSLNMSKQLSINKDTAWLFMKKVRIAMESSYQYPMNGNIEVDDIYVGGKEAGKRGRGSENKKQLVVAIEKQGEWGIRRAYAIKIKNSSAEELARIFEKHIDKSAKIRTDKWSGFKPLEKTYQITKEKSKPGKNFQLMNRFVQGVQSWFRGIYHHVSDRHIQSYVNEYCFRFNRQNTKETIFNNLLKRMVSKPQITYTEIIQT